MLTYATILTGYSCKDPLSFHSRGVREQREPGQMLSECPERVQTGHLSGVTVWYAFLRSPTALIGPQILIPLCPRAILLHILKEQSAQLAVQETANPPISAWLSSFQAAVVKPR